jgi:hypothetical protein
MFILNLIKYLFNCLKEDEFIFQKYLKKRIILKK